MNSKGTSLILFLIFLPVFLVAGSIFLRNSEFMVLENRLVNQCQKHVLESAARQAEGLALLGQLNPIAKGIIDSKRAVILAMAQGLPPPIGIPIVSSLQNAQNGVELTQTVIKGEAVARALLWLARPWAGEFQKLTRRWHPKLPSTSHGSSEAMLLHVQKMANYEMEVGAPLSLDADFSSAQKSQMELTILSQRLLSSQLRDPLKSPGQRLSDLAPIKRICAAKVFMNHLEDSWKVQLIEPSRGYYL